MASTLVAAIGAISPAHAVFRSFNLTPANFALGGGATGSANSTGLPDAGTPDIAFNIVLPAEYQANSILNVRLIMSAANGGGASCSVVMEPVAATRRRNGIESLQTLGGIAPANGSTSVGFGPGKTNYKAFSIGPAGVAPYLDMQPSDQLFVRIRRNAADPADTCAFPAFVFGVEVRYTAAK